jgi:hypothetical protein
LKGGVVEQFKIDIRTQSCKARTCNTGAADGQVGLTV